MRRQNKTIVIAREFKGLRLDVFLAKAKIAPARAGALRLISEKRALLNGAEAKASRRLKAGDILKIALPALEERGLSPYSFPLDIVFEDESILIVNKPAGIVAHPRRGIKTKLWSIFCFIKKSCRPALSPFVRE